MGVHTAVSLSLLRSSPSFALRAPPLLGSLIRIATSPATDSLSLPLTYLRTHTSIVMIMRWHLTSYLKCTALVAAVVAVTVGLPATVASMASGESTTASTTLPDAHPHQVRMTSRHSDLLSRVSHFESALPTPVHVSPRTKLGFSGGAAASDTAASRATIHASVLRVRLSAFGREFTLHLERNEELLAKEYEYTRSDTHTHRHTAMRAWIDAYEFVCEHRTLVSTVRCRMEQNVRGLLRCTVTIERARW
jgi:hypothetical protein